MGDAPMGNVPMGDVPMGDAVEPPRRRIRPEGDGDGGGGDDDYDDDYDDDGAPIELNGLSQASGEATELHEYDIGNMNTQGLPSINELGTALELGSMGAQKSHEHRNRMSHTLSQLKQEITCMHIVYDPLIPVLTHPSHTHAKLNALASTDIRTVRTHHRTMQAHVRRYYKTTDLKVGVIISAEKVMGVQSGAGEVTHGVSITKAGHDKFANSKKVTEEVMRGGINTKAILKNRMPPFKPQVFGHPTRLPTFLTRDDHEHPSVQFMRRPLDVFIRTK
jgi:hypothetical protein